MRSLENLTLDLDGMTVLIGDNGTGKSAMLQAFELLRQAVGPAKFVPDILIRLDGRALVDRLREGSRSDSRGLV